MAVADLMRDDVVTARPDESAGELARRMRDEGVRSVVVDEDDGTLAGIVALDDLHVLLALEQRNLAAVIEAESPPY